VENPDDNDGDLFQTNLMQMLLAKRHGMPKAHVPAGGDNDNNDNGGNDDEECPAGYDYCIRRVCNGNFCGYQIPLQNL
jgi:hypothetical protein